MARRKAACLGGPAVVGGHHACSRAGVDEGSAETMWQGLWRLRRYEGHIPSRCSGTPDSYTPSDCTVTTPQPLPPGSAWSAALGGLLAQRIAPALGEPAAALRLVLQGGVVPRPDASWVYRVDRADGRPCAVLLCAPPAAPQIVQRAMQQARMAQNLIGPELGRHILEPLAEGHVEGLSYALLPYCVALARGGVAWRVQCAWLRPALFEWLYRVCAATVQPVDEALAEQQFAAPLAALASLPDIDETVRGAARRAWRRLDDGQWKPRTALMHGDLWKGNVLLRVPERLSERWRWRERFVVIDWPGAQARGPALFDLVRLAQSLRLRRAALRVEVDRHCAVLGCDRADAMSHLLAAVGQMAASLEHFPMASFLRMVRDCHTSLAEVV